MSRFLQYTFQPCDPQAVFLTKLVNQAGNLILDGTLSNPYNPTVPLLANGGTSRSLSITSNGDATGSVFTITGTQNGIELSTQYAGPNNTRAYHPDIFDTITSISVDVAPNCNISIGTGYVGYFPPIRVNLEKDIINYALTVGQTSVNAIPTELFATLIDIPNSNETLDTLVESYEMFSIQALGATHQYYYESIVPYSYLVVQVVGLIGNIGDSINLKFRQV